MREETGPIGSTRTFEMTEGELTYPEVSERLAVSLPGSSIAFTDPAT